LRSSDKLPALLSSLVFDSFCDAGQDTGYRHKDKGKRLKEKGEEKSTKQMSHAETAERREEKREKPFDWLNYV
jgi:hypothetical protein